ncbi:MAG: class II fructose-bisphosphate aldolase [Holosporales bacterium]|nr:class II fructose-bisphosphate aldolase [Holosporales bacterium]
MFINNKLVSGSEILREALLKKSAIGAFNFINMETVQGVVEAANEFGVSVILQASESTIKYMGFSYLKSIISAAADESKVPLVLHLDHGSSFEICKKCIDEGFSSIMIDASSLNFDENVIKTKEVVNYAKLFGVSVEAELGTLAGIEDEVEVSMTNAIYTDPDEAFEFIEKTGIDSLAIAIGTSHGPNKGKGANPKLSIDILKRIKQKIGDFPLVLHGASSVYSDEVEICNRYGANLKDTFGITDSDLKEAIQNGISKINVDTDVRIAFLGSIRQSIEENKSNIDIRKYLAAGKRSIKNIALRKLKMYTSH